jgi:hypothetical protein
MENGKRPLRGTSFKVDEINEVERDLLKNIDKFDAPAKLKRQMANLVSNRLLMIKSLIRHERLLESEFGVEFTRSN